MKNFSLIIPIYNSASILPSTLKELSNFFVIKEYFNELVFVDDGSTDESLSIVEKFSHDPAFGQKTRLISHTTNMGKGASIRDGILSLADGDGYVFFIDDDLPFGLLVLEQMYLKICNDNNIDIIIGDRTLVNQSNPYPLFRRIGSAIFSFLLHGQVTRKFPDTQCGLKGFKVTVAKKIFSKVKSTRWSFDAETIFMAVRNHLSVVRFPVTLSPHTHATVIPVSNFLNIIIEVLRIRLRSFSHYYLISK